ncbi:MAG: DUF5060 domain-containing protein [Planctomycetes bacterium]|nr:DUF5060 domain-containing protein [Planctomycetota bacterium]
MQGITCSVFVAIGVLSALAGCAGATGQPGHPAKDDSLPVVPMYDVFETTLTPNGQFDNPFRDVAVTAEFISPGGRRVSVEGFYFGQGQWRVRFVPRAQGRWRYSVKLAGPDGPTAGDSGEFICRGVTRRGSLRISKRNRYRMEYEDGTPFYPIGVQTCGYERVGFDGPRGDGPWTSVPAEQWCHAFEGAVNLLRWQLGAGTTGGCALPLIAKDGPLDKYDTKLAGKMDDLMRLQKSSGFSHIMNFFQDMSLWGAAKTAFGQGRDLKNYKSVSAANMPLQEQYIRYVVARWGCYVDIWELFNEDAWAPDDYLAHLAAVVRKADPYDHIITTNYSRGEQDWCEIVTAHEYMGMKACDVDVYIAAEIGKFKTYGKVVQYTEFGNQGWLSNYDPVKWRIATWTAFMNESGILFWGMSGHIVEGKRPYRGNANAYLGADSRKYFRVLADFTAGMPIDMKPVACGYTEHQNIRVYALSNGAVTALYVNHFSDHTKEHQFPDPLFVRTGPGTFKLHWINPADGGTVRTGQKKTDGIFLKLRLPPITMDLACRIDRMDE